MIFKCYIFENCDNIQKKLYFCFPFSVLRSWWGGRTGAGSPGCPPPGTGCSSKHIYQSINQSINLSRNQSTYGLID